MFGEVTAQEYANTLAGQLMSYSDQGITYNFKWYYRQCHWYEPVCIFRRYGGISGRYIYQYYAVDGKWRTDDYNHCHRTGRSRQAECEAVLSSIQPLPQN